MWNSHETEPETLAVNGLGGTHPMTTPKELAEEPVAFEFYLMGLARGSAVFDPEMLDQVAAFIRRSVGANRELAEEFRRLAEESRATAGNLEVADFENHAFFEGKIRAFRQAAQMMVRELGGGVKMTKSRALNLRELREAKGISRRRLAVWIDCSEADLERFENGEPTLSTQQIADVADILGVMDDDDSFQAMATEIPSNVYPRKRKIRPPSISPPTQPPTTESGNNDPRP